MKETAIVELIRQKALRGVQDQRLIRGIGDDCAILRPKAKEDLVFTSDFALQDRHFRLSTHTGMQIGELALARSLSDLAAMGAEPVFCLVSLAVPEQLGGAFVESFYDGLLRVAKRYAVSLAGGDLSRFDKVIADVTCCGRVPRGKALLRSGAKAGHLIYVSGSLGGAAHALRERQPILPTPRLDVGRALSKLGVSAAMDISDGLSLDLARMCKASEVSAEIASDKVPVAKGATLEDALHGGEDYELLFTAAPAKKMPAGMREIGVIKRGRVGQVFIDGERIHSKGFDHFA